MASSALLAAPAAAQPPPETSAETALPSGPRNTRLETRRSGMGRDQFIAPVMGIQIEGDGVNLPPEAAEEAEPAKPAARPAGAPAAETKREEPRSTGK